MNKKLLIIDDQRGIASVVGQVAQAMAFEVEILTNSIDATEVFLAFQPDIVVLDMIMPGKDGIDVLNEILLTDIPTRIVLVSGAGNAYLKLGQSIAHFHGNDQVTVLAKPFRRAELIAALGVQRSTIRMHSERHAGAA